MAEALMGCDECQHHYRPTFGYHGRELCAYCLWVVRYEKELGTEQMRRDLRAFASYLLRYHDVTLADVEPSSVQGYWTLIPPCEERDARTGDNHYLANHFGGNGRPCAPRTHTVSFRDDVPPADYPRGRFFSPFRTWRMMRDLMLAGLVNNQQFEPGRMTDVELLQRAGWTVKEWATGWWRASKEFPDGSEIGIRRRDTGSLFVMAMTFDRERSALPNVGIP